MKIEVRLILKVYGDEFSPLDLNNKLPKKMRGDISKIKSIDSSDLGDYWYLECLDFDEADLENSLCELILKYADYLHEYTDAEKYASIVYKFKSLDQVRGFFISKDLMTVCSEAGFEIDIDLY